MGMKPRKQPERVTVARTEQRTPHIRKANGHDSRCVFDGFDWWCFTKCPKAAKKEPAPFGAETVDVENSSMIKRLRYVSATSQLQAVFINGQTYLYEDVPLHVFQSITAADSVGKAFSARIVRGGYEYTKGEKNNDQTTKEQEEDSQAVSEQRNDRGQPG